MTFDETVNRLVADLPKYSNFFPHHLEIAISSLNDDRKYPNIMNAFNTIRGLLAIPGVALSTESKKIRCEILALLGKSESNLMSKFFQKRK